MGLISSSLLTNQATQTANAFEQAFKRGIKQASVIIHLEAFLDHVFGENSAANTSWAARSDYWRKRFGSLSDEQVQEQVSQLALAYISNQTF